MKQFLSRSLAILAVSGMILLMSGAAEAGLPRILSMGMEEDTVWMIEKDETHVSENAAYLSKVAPQLTVGYAGTIITNPYGWIVFSPIDNLNLLVSTGMPLEDTAFAGGSPAAGVDMDYEQFAITGSYDMGNMIFGAGTSFSYMKDDGGAGDPDTNLVWTLDLGMIMELSSAMTVDAGVFLNVWSADTPSNTYERTTADFGANGRLNWSLSELNTLHVFFKYAYLGRTSTVGGTEVETTYHNVYAGISDEMKITKNSMVFGGLQYSMENTALAAGDLYTHKIKLVLGGEVEMFKAVKARLGVHRVLFDRDTTDPGDTVDDSVNTTVAAFGLGITLGNVLFDMNVSLPILTTGPDFISGGGGPGGWSTDFEAKYYFETGSKK